MAHRTGALHASQKIQDVMPPKLNKTLSPLLKMMSLSIAPLKINFYALGRLNATSSPCDEIVGAMSDYERKIRGARSTLNNTAAMPPPY